MSTSKYSTLKPHEIAEQIVAKEALPKNSYRTGVINILHELLGDLVCREEKIKLLTGAEVRRIQASKTESPQVLKITP